MSEARRRLEYEVLRRHGRGESGRGIARALGIDRKTVRRILRNNERCRAEGPEALQRPSTPRPSKLDPYVDVIDALLRRYPDIKAKRVLEELEGRGFRGGYTIVREHLQGVRPAARREPAMIVETPPGEQGQVDWAECKDGDGTPLYALLVTLGFSRHQYIELCSDMERPTVFRVMVRAFEYQDGVAEEYVFDSMPTIVDRWEAGRPILNLHAMDFAAHYRFAYHIAPRGDAKYKGKVERNVRGFRDGFLNGRTLYGPDVDNPRLRAWLDERRNRARHPKRSESRVELLAAEGLQPLPAHPYDTREVVWRLVDGYGYVRFEHNFYRAPDGASSGVGQWLCVRVGERTVELYDPMAQPLASYERAPRGARRYIPEPEATGHRRRRTSEMLECFAQWGERAHHWAQQLRRNKRYAGVEMEAVLALQQTYSLSDVLAAIDHATRYGAFEAAAVRRILERRATPRTFAQQMSERGKAEIRQAMAASPVRQREVAAYGRLLAPRACLVRAPREATDEHQKPDPPPGGDP